MTFGEALAAASLHGETHAEQRPYDEGPPTPLPHELRGIFDDAKTEALISVMREAWWRHRYYSLRMKYARSQRRLEDVA